MRNSKTSKNNTAFIKKNNKLDNIMENETSKQKSNQSVLFYRKSCQANAFTDLNNNKNKQSKFCIFSKYFKNKSGFSIQ